MAAILDTMVESASLELRSMKASLARMQRKYDNLNNNNQKLQMYHTDLVKGNDAIAVVNTRRPNLGCSPLTADELQELKASKGGFGSGSVKQFPTKLPLPESVLDIDLVHTSPAAATSSPRMFNPPGPGGGIHHTRTHSTPGVPQRPFPATCNHSNMAPRSSYHPPQEEQQLRSSYPPPQEEQQLSGGWPFVPHHSGSDRGGHRNSSDSGGGGPQRGGSCSGMHPYSIKDESDHELPPYDGGHHNVEVSSSMLRALPVGEVERACHDMWTLSDEMDHFVALNDMDDHCPGDLLLGEAPDLDMELDNAAHTTDPGTLFGGRSSIGTGWASEEDFLYEELDGIIG